MKIIGNICRIIVGIVFIYSGFVKGVDPLGSVYKFTDYFNAFGTEWLNPMALSLSFLLSLFEFLTGTALLFNLRIRWAAWGALLFMCFFTPLTLILALTNPVSDCGCFGDALVLSNWQTFWKNIILLILTSGIFIHKTQFRTPLAPGRQIILLFLLGAGMLTLSVYCYRNLPVLDFRPYAIGRNIQEGIRLPEGAEPDQYQVIFKYKNKQTGEIGTFTEQNYPWQDTLHWEYESSSERLIQKGYTPPIHDLFIEHPELGNITEEILEDDGYTFLVVAYDLKKSDTQVQAAINELARYAQDKGYRFYGLTSSSPHEALQFRTRHQVPYDYCSSDEIQLKTIIRSNPGILLLRNGTILGKWSADNIPDVEELKNKDLLAYCLTWQQELKTKYLVYSFIFLFFMTYLLFQGKKRKRDR